MPPLHRHGIAERDRVRGVDDRFLRERKGELDRVLKCLSRRRQPLGANGSPRQSACGE